VQDYLRSEEFTSAIFKGLASCSLRVVIIQKKMLLKGQLFQLKGVERNVSTILRHLLSEFTVDPPVSIPLVLAG